MTLPIHEQGGLLASEVDLRINEASYTQVTAVETKLKEHQEAIECRLSMTDEAVKDNLERTIELKTDVAVLMASDSRQTELLESIADNGNKWHEADVAHRVDMVQRVTAIEVEQNRLSEQVKIIRWFVAVSAGITKSLGLCLKLLCTEAFWNIAGISILLFVLGKFCPYLFHLASAIFGLH